MNGNGHPWPAELLDALKALVAARKFSAYEMAIELTARFGRDLTRNAVIGKLYRLGIKGWAMKRERKPRKRKPHAPQTAKPLLVVPKEPAPPRMQTKKAKPGRLCFLMMTGYR